MGCMIFRAKKGQCLLHYTNFSYCSTIFSNSTLASSLHQPTAFSNPCWIIHHTSQQQSYPIPYSPIPHTSQWYSLIPCQLILCTSQQQPCLIYVVQFLFIIARWWAVPRLHAVISHPVVIAVISTRSILSLPLVLAIYPSYHCHYRQLYILQLLFSASSILLFSLSLVM